jgi:hypothetical protein
MNNSQDFPLSIAIYSIQDRIQAFTGNNEKYVTYELIITNGTKNPIRIIGVNISGILSKHKNSLYEMNITDKELSRNFLKISNINSGIPEIPILQRNETGIIYLFLNFCHKVPDLLNNKIYIQNDISDTQSIIINPIIINKCEPIIINPPLLGKHWLAFNAPSELSTHRKATVMYNGKIKLPERYALDFIKFGPKGLYDGDPLINSSYYSYGKTIYSVGKGKVIQIIDGIPDNVPGSFPESVTLNTILGNYVLIKLDSDHYVSFSHMIPGSIKVTEGDIVCQGQILGLLGNSGNSNAPHLHFQMSNKPRPIGNDKRYFVLNAEGVPWVLNKFIKEEYIPIGFENMNTSMSANVKITSKSLINNQILMENNLVTFR